MCEIWKVPLTGNILYENRVYISNNLDLKELKKEKNQKGKLNDLVNKSQQSL